MAASFTSLAGQLRKLQAPQTNQLRQTKGRDSFLYEYGEAANITEDAHHALAVSGFQSLCQTEPNLERFQRTLFNESSKSFQRAIQNSEANAKLNVVIEEFLTEAISPYFMLTNAHKCLEWLIIKYRVHEFNTDALLCAVLPYHETRLFGRVVQICREVKNVTSNWNWLDFLNKSALLTLPKTTLLNRCVSDVGFLKLISDYSKDAACLNNNVFVSFCTATLIGTLNLSTDSSIIEVALVHVTDCLKSKTSASVCSGYAVFAYLAMKSRENGSTLSEKIVSKVLTRSAKRFKKYAFAENIASEYYDFLTVICHYQEVRILSSKVMDVIDVSNLANFGTGVKSSSFLSALCVALIQSSSNDSRKEKLLDILLTCKLSASVVMNCLVAITEKFNSDEDLDEEATKNLGSIMELLERKYPSEMDRAIQLINPENISQIYSSILWSDDKGNTSLNASLHHANPAVRISALKQLKKQANKTPEILESSVLSSGLFSCFLDSNVDVLDALLQCESAFKHFMTEKQLVSNLKRVAECCAVSLQVREDDSQVVGLLKVKQKAIAVLCNVQENPLVTSFIFDQMLPRSEIDIQTTKFILGLKTIPPGLRDFVGKVDFKTITTTSGVFNAIAETFAQALTNNSNPTMVSILLEKKDSPLHVAFSIQCARFLMEKSSDFAIVNKIVVDVIGNLKYCLRKSMKMKGSKNPDDFAAVMKIILKNRLPLDLLRDFFTTLSENIICQDVKPEHKWYWSSQNQRNNYCVAAYEFLADYAFANSKKNGELFQRLLTAFISKVYHRIGCQFFTASWLLLTNPKLQIRSLALSIKAQIPFSLKNLSNEDFISLLIALRSPLREVRSLAIKLLSQVLDGKLDKDEAEFVENAEHVTKVVSEWLKDSNKSVGSSMFVLKDSKCDWVALIAKHIHSASTPLHVKFGLLTLTISVYNLPVDFDTVLVDSSSLPTEGSLREKVIEENIIRIMNSLSLDTNSEEPCDASKQIPFIFKLAVSEKLAEIVCKRLTKRWFASLPSDHERVAIICNLLDKYGDSPLWTKKVKNFLKDGQVLSHVVKELSCGPGEKTGSPMVRRRRRTQERLNFELDSESMKKLIVLLELVQSGTKFANSTPYMRNCFTLLKESFLKEQGDNTLEYLRKLLLANIQVCIEQSDVDKSCFDIHCVLESFRFLRTLDGQRQSLSLISLVAEDFKQDILQNIVLIFGYFGINVVQHDDAYTTQVIDEMMHSLIPAVTEQDKTRDTVVDIFMDAMLDIPAHRRLHIFTTLCELCGLENVLWYIEIRLLERSGRKEVENKDVYLNFAVDLMVNSDLKAQVEAMKVLLEISGLLDDGATATFRGRRFGVTSAQRQQLVELVLATILRICSDERFVEMVAFHEWTKIRPAFENLVSVLMEQIDSTANKQQRRKSFSSNSKSYLRTLYKILGKINDLLPNRDMILIVSTLLTNEKLSVKRIAVELLNAKLSKSAHFEPVLLESLIEPVKNLISRDSVSSATQNVGQLALLTLKLISKNLEKSKTSSNTLQELLTFVLGIAPASQDKAHTSFDSSVVIALSQLAVSVGTPAISSLPEIMPLIVSMLASSSPLVAFTALTCFNKITKTFSKFLSPYTKDLFVGMCKIKIDSSTENAAMLSNKYKVIRKSLAQQTPIRSLFASLDDIFEKLQSDDQAVIELLQLINFCCKKNKKSDLEAVVTEFQRFAIKILDYSSQHREGNASRELVESHCTALMVSFLPKLPETSFKHSFCKIYNWAIESSETSQSRVSVFYKLMADLVEIMQTLFCAFVAPYILTNCIAVLKNSHHMVGSGADEYTTTVVHRSLTNVLITLGKCFLHDINGLFATKERLQFVAEAVIDQLTNELGTPEQYEARIANGVSKCVEFMVRASSDNLVVRDIHYKLMLKTRANSPRVRLQTLRVLQRLILSMNEEYVSLLPEAVPYLAELHEDDDEAIQSLLKIIFSDVEQITGEPISNYF